jgi:isopentenyl-diphosphate delta-isomerase
MAKVILVDQADRPIGTEEKLKAHQEGKLHRAFSIFIFNQKGQLMLQQRAKSKYHCGSLWTNTCCSHPRPRESLNVATHRRLKEEMGFDCPLEEVFNFTYKARFSNGLTENEYDHVFIGQFDGQPRVNPEEADGWRWATPKKLLKEIKESPQKFTPWFKESIERVLTLFESAKNPLPKVKIGFYRHYKGNLYKVLGTARHSENLEELVVYQALYDSKEFGQKAFWVRPKKMFLEEVKVNGKKVPRFKYLGKSAIVKAK